MSWRTFSKKIKILKIGLLLKVTTSNIGHEVTASKNDRKLKFVFLMDRADHQLSNDVLV